MEKKILSFEDFSSNKKKELPENNEFWNDFEIEEEEESEEEEWVIVGNVGLDELFEGEDSEVLEKCV